MRHRNKTKTLGRKRAPRKAMMKNLAESLILHGSIRTTSAKAKQLRTVVEPMITKAKKGDIATRRLLISRLFTNKAVNKLLNDLGPKYKERKGGYTRITKLGPRANDAAEMVKIELV
jgi:large subunit ribosomal protein L17